MRLWLQVSAIALTFLTSTSFASAAETPPDLRKPAAGEWLHVGGDWSNSRYSTLSQVTPANVKDLKGANLRTVLRILCESKAR